MKSQTHIHAYHIDAYRLTGDDDFAALGGGEYLGTEGIAVIEWSERIPASLPDNAVTVDIRINSDGGRCIEIQEPPPDAEAGDASVYELRKNHKVTRSHAK